MTNTKHPPPTLWVKWISDPAENSDDGFWFTADFETPGSTAYTLSPNRAQGDEMSRTFISPNHDDFAVLTPHEEREFFGWVPADEFVAAQAAELATARQRIAELEAALREISEFDACDRKGYIDEWEEAWAFDECKKIASAILNKVQS